MGQTSEVCFVWDFTKWSMEEVTILWVNERWKERRAGQSYLCNNEERLIQGRKTVEEMVLSYCCFPWKTSAFLMGVANKEVKNCIYKWAPQYQDCSGQFEKNILTEIFTLFANEISKLMRKVSRGLGNLMLMRAETIYHGRSLFKYSYSKNRPNLSDHDRSGLDMK